MTGKEKAEEYVSNLLKDVNCNIGNPRARHINSIDVEDAFIAGFQAGRPVWHDLRKDKNDLPDILCYVWTNVGAGYYDGNHWRDEFGRLRNVVAWCEPKFEED